MPAEEIVSDKQDSIEVSRTAKGTHSWKLKLYYDSSKVETVDTIKKLKMMDELMEKQFGHNDGGD